MQYSKLVDVYEKLEGTTKRLGHTHIISEFLKDIDVDDLGTTILLLEGRVFPRWDERETGMASKMMLKAISVASGESKEMINSEWKKTGDLGTVSHNLIKKKKQHTLKAYELTVKKVLKNLRQISTIEGMGSVDKKISLVAELLTSAKPNEAKYIVRTILNDMRIGVGEGSIRDSIVWAFFGKELEVKYNKEENNIEIEDRKKYNEYVGAVQKAYDVTNDFAPVAEAANVARSGNCLVFFDAVQAALRMRPADWVPFCDLFSVSAHKLYAPKGTALLWKKNVFYITVLL